MISCLSKWYQSCLAYLLTSCAAEPTTCLLGFERGRQCTEITECLRLLLQKADEWSLPLVIGKGDISKAFDSIEHSVLDRSLSYRKIPLALRVATLRELVDLTLEIHLQDSTSDPVPLGKGGPQGNTATPRWWNFLVDYLLAPVAESWATRGFGFDLEDGLSPLSHLVWADDNFWIAVSFQQFAIMTQELTYGYNDGCLGWKPESLHFMANKTALENWPSGQHKNVFSCLTRSGAPAVFHRVEQLPVLGVLVDDAGTTHCASEHRLTAGVSHYFARRPQLSCKRVSLRRRDARQYTTVSKSILWGAGGWVTSKALFQRVEVVELPLLRKTLSLPKRANEGFVDYLKRSNKGCRQVLRQSGCQSLSATILANIHGWAGHVARLPSHFPVARAARFRNLAWWRDRRTRMQSLDPRNKTGWRHARPGPNTCWESSLDHFSPNWWALAQDRDKWISLRRMFVNSELCRFHCRNLTDCQPCLHALEDDHLSIRPPDELHVSLRLSDCPFYSQSAQPRLPRFICQGHSQHIVSYILTPTSSSLSEHPDSGHKHKNSLDLDSLRSSIFKTLRTLSMMSGLSPGEILCVHDSDNCSTLDLAETSLRQKDSHEQVFQWPDSFPASTAIIARYSSVCEKTHGSIGYSVSLSPPACPPSPLLHCRVYLGPYCSPDSAEIQACGLCLRSLLALCSSLASAAPPTSI